MTLLRTEQIPVVSLEFMNHDHAEAASQINQLALLLEDIRSGDTRLLVKIEPLLSAIYQHSKEHFVREETQMIRVGFPAFECHKEEHERVLEELSHVLKQWQQHTDVEFLEDFLNNTFCHWLINHISTMDSVTAMFVGRYDQSVA